MQSGRELIESEKGRIDLSTVERFFGDHESTICKHFATLDVLIFDTTSRTAHITRCPGCLGQWRKFSFAG